MFGSTVVSQYLVGLASPLGHSMSSVSSAKRASPRIGAARTRTRAKRDRSFTLVPFPPRDGAPGALGQAERQCFDADARRLRIVLAHRAYFDGRYDGCDVAEPQSREVLAQLAVVAVTRIHQHHAGSNARLQSRADLLQRNLRLG